MFPLLTKTFPASATELEKLLSESLRQIFVLRGDAVSVRDKNFPALQEIEIDLNGAQLRPDPPQPRMPSGATSPALTVDRFNVHADRLAVGPAAVELALNAETVALHQGHDAGDEIVLTLQSAGNGSVRVATTKANLESAIAEFAEREAGKQGVTIEDVRLNLRQVGPRAVESEANVRARKLFFTTTVRITARLEIDEQLNARISNLNCAGEGAIGSLACGFLAPHLQKVDGRTIPLMSFAMGEVRLREVQLSVGDRLEVQAEFGA